MSADQVLVLTPAISFSFIFDDTLINPSSGFVSGSSYFQATFVVPDSVQPGYHFISIRRDKQQSSGRKTILRTRPEIILSVWSGTVGTTIEAFCKGFHAGKEVNIQYYYYKFIADTRVSDSQRCRGMYGAIHHPGQFHRQPCSSCPK